MKELSSSLKNSFQRGGPVSFGETCDFKEMVDSAGCARTPVDQSVAFRLPGFLFHREPKPGAWNFIVFLSLPQWFSWEVDKLLLWLF